MSESKSGNAVLKMVIRVHRASTGTVDEYNLTAVEQEEPTKDSTNERDAHDNHSR